jgi:hypothetical protein
LVDEDAPIVDEEGTLGDPTDSGEGTSDDTAESSTAPAELSGESDPNADLTGEAESEEAPTARPAPKKGSAEERIVELNDTLEGTKIFAKHMQEQYRATVAELERIKAGGKPAQAQTAAAVAPPVEEDAPMPDLADPDIAFDNDKYRTKMAKWIDDRAEQKLRALKRADEAAQRRRKVETEIEEFAKATPDYKKVVTENPVLAANQLSPEAASAVVQSGFAGRLLYEFGKDPALAVRTAKQSPLQQVVTVGEILAKVKAESASKSKQGNGSKPNAQSGQQKSITKAPPPPSPTRAAGRAVTREITDPNMSVEEFARQHRLAKDSARKQSRQLRGLN